MKRSSVIGGMVGMIVCVIAFLAYQIQYVYTTLCRQAEMSSHAYNKHAVPLLELGDARMHLQQLMISGVTEEPLPTLRTAASYWQTYRKHADTDIDGVGAMEQTVSQNFLRLEDMTPEQWNNGYAMRMVRETSDLLVDIRRLRALALQRDFEGAEQRIEAAKTNAIWMLGGIALILSIAMAILYFNVARFFRQIDHVVSESQEGHILSMPESGGAFSEFSHINEGMLEMQKSLTHLIGVVSEDSMMLSRIVLKLPRLAENLRLRSLDSSLLAEDVVSDNTELRLGLAQIEMQLLELEAVLERASANLEPGAAAHAGQLLKRMDKTTRMLRLMVDERVAEINEMNNLVKEERQISEEMVQLSHQLKERYEELRRQVAWFRLS